MQFIWHGYYTYTEKFKEFLFLAEIHIWIHLDSTVEFKIKMHSMESWKKINFFQECIEKILWYLRLCAVYMVANILKFIWSQT